MSIRVVYIWNKTTLTITHKPKHNEQGMPSRQLCSSVSVLLIFIDLYQNDIHGGLALNHCGNEPAAMARARLSVILDVLAKLKFRKPHSFLSLRGMQITAITIKQRIGHLISSEIFDLNHTAIARLTMTNFLFTDDFFYLAHENQGQRSTYSRAGLL